MYFLDQQDEGAGCSNPKYAPGVNGLWLAAQQVALTLEAVACSEGGASMMSGCQSLDLPVSLCFPVIHKVRDLSRLLPSL